MSLMQSHRYSGTTALNLYTFSLICLIGKKRPSRSSPSSVKVYSGIPIVVSRKIWFLYNEPKMCAYGITPPSESSKSAPSYHSIPTKNLSRSVEGSTKNTSEKTVIGPPFVERSNCMKYAPFSRPILIMGAQKQIVEHPPLSITPHSEAIRLPIGTSPPSSSLQQTWKTETLLMLTPCAATVKKNGTRLRELTLWGYIPP